MWEIFRTFAADMELQENSIIHIFLSPFIFILFIITPQNYVFLARYRRRKCAKREKSGVNQRNLCGQR